MRVPWVLTGRMLSSAIRRVSQRTGVTDAEAFPGTMSSPPRGLVDPGCHGAHLPTSTHSLRAFLTRCHDRRSHGDA
jgi:hypothetical protein